MTLTEFCTPGRGEACKAIAHSSMLALAAVFVGYNGAAWWFRRRPHLLRNVALYGALALIEWQHLQHHRARVSC